jgi:hypothetical protein
MRRGSQHSVAEMRAWFAVGDGRFEVFAVFQEPLHALFKAGSFSIWAL